MFHPKLMFLTGIFIHTWSLINQLQILIIEFLFYIMVIDEKSPIIPWVDFGLHIHLLVVHGDDLTQQTG
jgi:hypothetical protein